MSSKKNYIIGMMLVVLLLICGCNENKDDDASKFQNSAQTQVSEISEDKATGNNDSEDILDNNYVTNESISSYENTASSDTTYSPNISVEGGIDSSNSLNGEQSQEEPDGNQSQENPDGNQSQDTSSGMSSIDWESDDVWGPRG